MTKPIHIPEHDIEISHWFNVSPGPLGFTPIDIYSYFTEELAKKNCKLAGGIQVKAICKMTIPASTMYPNKCEHCGSVRK